MHAPQRAVLAATLVGLVTMLLGPMVATPNAMAATTKPRVKFGISYGERLSRMSPADLEATLAVNVRAPHVLTAALAPAMAERGTGGIVVIGSWMAHVGHAFVGLYSATKAALAAWLDVLRRENRRSFGVLDVRPPHLDTGLETRALAGTPPPLPSPRPASEVVAAVLAGLEDDSRVLGWDPKAEQLVSRGS